MDKPIVVSVDSHAQAPQEAWPEYLEKRFHEYLPGLREEQDMTPWSGKTWCEPA